MSDFDLLTEYCQKLLCEGRINQNQYSYIICSWSEENPEKIKECLGDMNLQDGFSSFQREAERNEQDNAYQISAVQDMINEANLNLIKFKSELDPYQKKYDTKKLLFDNWDSRYKLYPENMRFKKEVEKVQADLATIQTDMTKFQQEVDNCEQQIRLWNEQLIELQRFVKI